MIRITSALERADPSKPTVPVPVERRKLAKRRWRGGADDGQEFGFDLERPLVHGSSIQETDTKVYVIAQTEETVIKIAASTQQEAAQIGWMVGNLHFPAQFRNDAILAENDLAVCQALERNHIVYETISTIFQPLAVLHSHHH